jgi:hypothetical protein
MYVLLAKKNSAGERKTALWTRPCLDLFLI